MKNNTEAKYRAALGKLYKMYMHVWFPSESRAVWTEVMVMPYAIRKIGGWWHYECDYIVLEPQYEMTYKPAPQPSKAFIRKATPLDKSAESYHVQPPDVK